MNYSPVSLLYVVSKIFERLVNDRLADHVYAGLFSDFQYGFRSSWSTADLLLTFVSDKISIAFNRSRATQAVALDKS